MTFTVTYRVQDGKPQQQTFEANSRAALFKLLNEKGLSAIRIDAGSQSNRPGESRRGTSVRAKLAVLGLAVVAVGVVIVACVLLLRKQEPVDAPSATDRPRGQISEQAPSKAGEYVEGPQEASGDVPKTSVEDDRPLTPEERRQAALERIAAAQKRNADLPMAHARKEQVLKTASDQILAMVADIAEGKDLPPLPIDAHFEKEFLDSLKVPIEINDSDDERIRTLKENVMTLRRELSERAEAGENVSQILKEYQVRMAEDYKTRAEIQQEARRILESGDREGAQEYVTEMNAALQQMGIKEIDMPMTAEERRAWAEEFISQMEAEKAQRENQR